MADIPFVITNAGRGALVAAGTAGTLPVTIAQVGVSPTAVVPAATATSLPGEVKRIGSVGGAAVAADTIHLTARDASSDVYDVKSMALYLADGTLFAIYGQPTSILSKSAAAIFFLAADIKFADIAASSITFGDTNFLNPPATETTQGVAEIATQAETNTGTDDVRFVTPLKLATRLAALFASVWHAGNDGSGSGLDADLLDGQHGAYYANIPARLGFTPANKAGDTFTGAVVVPSIQVSAGDVHLSRTTDPWGYIVRPVTAGYRNLGFACAGGAAPLDAVNFDAVSVTRQGAKIWDAGNDGAGSGLDADMLDGLDSSGYIKAYTNSWITSSEGTPRFYFANGGTTYFGCGASGGWSWQYANVDRASMDTAGNFTAKGFVRASDGTGSANLGSNGDITANRGNGTGALFFGSAGNRYLHFDGANYLLPGAWLYVNNSFVWTAGNDGAGSGLDADLLDGRNASEFALLTGAAFSGNVSAPGFNLNLSSAGMFNSGGQLVLSGDANDYYYYDRAGNAHNFIIGGSYQAHIDGGGYVNAAAGFRAAGNTVWHAGNDGSGSGLDADLLDGHDSSAFERIVAQDLSANGGYIVYASGRKECWGIIVLAPNSGGVWNLPTPHASWVNPQTEAEVQYGNISQNENCGISAINGAPPSSLTLYNADNFTRTIHIRTIGV